MQNRITEAYTRMEAQIKDRIAQGVTTKEKVDAAHGAYDMDVMEHAKFQTLKSLAVSRNLLTLEEAQTIYVSLGEVVSVFNKQPVHVKAVLTSFFRELLTLEIKLKGGRRRR